MQLTQSNYLQFRDTVDWSRMPAVLVDKPKAVADAAAAKGWADMGEQTQKASDMFFKLCNGLFVKDPSLIKSEGTTKPSPLPSVAAKANPSVRPTTKTERNQRKVKNHDSPPKSDMPSGSKLFIDLPAGIPQPNQVPVIPTHTAFIKRYLTMHGKIKTRDQIVTLLHGLQKAITEQRIGKSTPAIREIQKMQSELITLAEEIGDKAKIEIIEPYLTHYKEVARGEEVRTSVKLLKQFIQVNGKSPDKGKAEKLGKKMAAAYDAIPAEDIYRTELAAGAKALADYAGGTTKTVGIPEAALHGLGSVAVGYSVDGLGIVAGSGEGAVIRLLRDQGVKNLSDATLKRAFRKTVVPGLCFEIAKSLMLRGELTMNVLNNTPIKRRTYGLSGVGDDSEATSGRITDLDILEMKLSGNRTSQSNVSGLGDVGIANLQKDVPAQQPTAHATPFNNGKTGAVSARELAKMQFKTIGYTGRFKDVVGDPAVGFHMMVYGKPFQGKSSFVIEVCKDLAQLKQGKVAYLALEEGISLSMQKKIIDRQADNVDGLDFLGTMPTSFAGYSFIVIDSVSDRSIKREKLRELFLSNPQTCFICIFHATKEGTARGGLDYSHDMDIIIRIEDHKPYVEKNRFL